MMRKAPALLKLPVLLSAVSVIGPAQILVSAYSQYSAVQPDSPGPLRVRDSLVIPMLPWRTSVAPLLTIVPALVCPRARLFSVHSQPCWSNVGPVYVLA